MSVYYFVTADCSDAIEAKYNDWFDNVHLPLLAKHSKLRSVSRYRWSQASKEFVENSGIRVATDWPKYLTVYEFDTQADAEEFLTSKEFKEGGQEAAQTWKPGEISVPWRVHYELKWQKHVPTK